MLIWFLRGPRAAGSAAALFTLWYAGGRVGLDFLRTDPTRAFGLTGTQLASPASAGLAASEGSPGQGAEDYDTP